MLGFKNQWPTVTLASGIPIENKNIDTDNFRIFHVSNFYFKQKTNQEFFSGRLSSIKLV